MTPYNAIIEKVRDHLLKQGKRSVISVSGNNESPPTIKCVYRDPEGNRCAIGALMTEEALGMLQEKGALTQGIWNSFVRKALVMSGYETTEDDCNFLRRLQFIHDRCDQEAWMSELDAAKISFQGAIKSPGESQSQ